MLHFSWSFKLCQWPAIPFIVLGLAATIPVTAGTAQAREARYDQCARDLLEAGIEADTAATACALALRPTEVSDCVVDVTRVSAVLPEVALSACSRDRRPTEVANCVADIHQDLDVADPTPVLVLCHRSLLPERYAACVTGLAETIGYDTETSLARCIAAGYRPENVAPTYIPN